MCRGGRQQQVVELAGEGGQAAHAGFIRSLALSPGAALLLSGGDDKACRLWDVSTLKCLATW